MKTRKRIPHRVLRNLLLFLTLPNVTQKCYKYTYNFPELPPLVIYDNTFHRWKNRIQPLPLPIKRKNRKCLFFL
jgi:hypothetical protein